MIKLYPYNIRLNLPRNSNIFVISVAALYQLVGTKITSQDIAKIKRESNSNSSLRTISSRIFSELKGDYFNFTKPLNRKVPFKAIASALNSKDAVAALIRFENNEMGFVVNESGTYVIYVENLTIKSASKLKDWLAIEIIYFELILIRDVTDYVRTGPQLGSNPGGTYEDPKTGDKWYIKHSTSDNHAHNEILATKLYELCGIPTPEMHLATTEHGLGTASKMIDKLESEFDYDIEDLIDIPFVLEGFIPDCWLANWDSIGSYNTRVHQNGTGIRIDTGGALLYRAQGAPKGERFGDTVGELETLRDPGMNVAGRVFGDMTADQIKESAKRVINLSNAQIIQTVDLYGPDDKKINQRLKQTLINRRDYIADYITDL